MLSGPIPQLLHQYPEQAPPIITSPSPIELELFASKQPMQFLISLVELEDSDPTNETINGFLGLDYWTEAFEQTPGLIMHRDISYAEGHNRSGGGSSSGIGGIQSFSFDPAPVCNRSMHWAAHQQWLQDRQVRVKNMIGQFYSDTYYFHYPHGGDDIAQKKPWRLTGEAQLQKETMTMYIGGAAAYETVEDVMAYNLELVQRFFDKGTVEAEVDMEMDEVDMQMDEVDTGGTEVAEELETVAGTEEQRSVVKSQRGLEREGASHERVLEQLEFVINTTALDHFLWADNQSWTAFLQHTPGFMRKLTLVEPPPKSDPNNDDQLPLQPLSTDSRRADTSAGSRETRTLGATMRVWCTVLWRSRQLWKSIPSTDLQRVNAQFVSAFEDNGGKDQYGAAPVPRSLPTSMGLDELLRIEANAATGDPPRESNHPHAVEVHTFALDLDRGDSVDRFVAADNASFTPMLLQQPGFLGKTTLVNPSAGCTQNGSGLVARDSDDAMNCTMWVVSYWSTRAQWDAVPIAAIINASAHFQQIYPPLYPNDPARSGFPSDRGFDVLRVAYPTNTSH
jgi:hypothetical protein